MASVTRCRRGISSLVSIEESSRHPGRSDGVAVKEAEVPRNPSGRAKLWQEMSLLSTLKDFSEMVALWFV